MAWEQEPESETSLGGSAPSGAAENAGKSGRRGGQCKYLKRKIGCNGIIVKEWKAIYGSILLKVP